MTARNGELVAALIAECERAMAQRDEYLKTGVSTASHGGSHDTRFHDILRNFGVGDPQYDTNMALYAGLWRHGLPNVNRSGQSLQQFIDSVTDHLRRKMENPMAQPLKRKPYIDVRRLAYDTDAKAARERKTMKDVSGETGVPEHTLCRMKTESRTPSPAYLLALCEWLGKAPGEYLLREE